MVLDAVAQAEFGAAHDLEFRLRVSPLVATGEVLLADASERVFARFGLPLRASSADRTLDLAVVLAEGESELLVAHELRSGRRSPWRRVRLEAGAWRGSQQ